MKPIENRVDRISIMGSLDISRDKIGLAKAKELQAILSAATSILESDEALPDEIQVAAPDQVANPFK